MTSSVVSAVRNLGQVMLQVLSFCLSLASATLLGTTVLFAEGMKAQRKFSLNYQISESILIQFGLACTPPPARKQKVMAEDINNFRIFG